MMSCRQTDEMPYGDGGGICMGARQGDGENTRRLSRDGAGNRSAGAEQKTPRVILFTGGCGSGKTTFARKLFAELQREGIRTVYAAQQNACLLDRDTAAANIMLRDASACEAEEAGREGTRPGSLVRLQELAGAFAFEGSLQRQCSELSGGEKRITQILRGLYQIRTGGVLILDEPTNDLDPEQTGRLVRVLDAAAGPLIIITHDDRLTGLADQIVEFPLQGKDSEILPAIRAAAERAGEKQEAGRPAAEQDAFFRKRMLKKPLFIAFYAVMMLFAAAVCIFCSAFSAHGTEAVMPQEKEIDLILPDSDYGAAALTSGAVPVKILAALSGDLPIGEKARLLAEAQANIGRVPVNHDSLEDLPEEYASWPLEYLLPEERTYINIVEMYSEQYAPESRVNLSVLFSAEEEPAPEDAVPAEEGLLRELAVQTAQENVGAGITYLVLRTDSGGLSDFLESETFRELADSDVFIKSRETVELSALITERTRIVQIAAAAAAGEGILMLIFLISYAVLLAAGKKPFLVMRDAGFGKEAVLQTAGQAHRAGAARLILLSASIVLCSLLCRGGLTYTAAAFLPGAGISEFFACLLSVTDRIVIHTIMTGDL